MTHKGYILTKNSLLRFDSNANWFHKICVRAFFSRCCPEGNFFAILDEMILFTQNAVKGYLCPEEQPLLQLFQQSQEEIHGSSCWLPLPLLCLCLLKPP